MFHFKKLNTRYFSKFVWKEGGGGEGRESRYSIARLFQRVDCFGALKRASFRKRKQKAVSEKLFLRRLSALGSRLGGFRLGRLCLGGRGLGGLLSLGQILGLGGGLLFRRRRRRLDLLRRRCLGGLPRRRRLLLGRLPGLGRLLRRGRLPRDLLLGSLLGGRAAFLGDALHHLTLRTGLGGRELERARRALPLGLHHRAGRHGRLQVSLDEGGELLAVDLVSRDDVLLDSQHGRALAILQLLDGGRNHLRGRRMRRLGTLSLRFRLGGFLSRGRGRIFYSRGVTRRVLILHGDICERERDIIVQTFADEEYKYKLSF